MTAPAASDADALFRRDGHDLLPTIYTQGPWNPGAQHGGPVCAALAAVIEGTPSLAPMQVSRLTFDLFRPAPLTRLRTTRRVVRDGKRLQLVEAMLLDGDVPVARGSAMRVRVLDTAEVLEHPLRPVHERPPLPGAAHRPDAAVAARIGFLRALEIDRVSGPAGSGGPSVSWFRSTVPLIEGEAMTPLQRLALFADFTSSSAAYLDHASYSAINPDVTVQVLRLPAGEWLCVDGTTEAGAFGMGHSRALLWDVDGFVATATTSQLIDPVRAPFA